ncbi:MAG: amidohydrolase family protein [Candidatus Thorarchaeota archaeon]
MKEHWKYTGPIFDAHTHIGTLDELSKMIAVEEDFGIQAQIGIVHSEDEFLAARERYPNLSLRDIAQFNVDPVLDQISSLKDEGYLLAKTWFGPRWRDYVEILPAGFRLDHPRLEPMFQSLEDNGVPLIIHVADPDTYFAAQYSDSKKYGTKEEHLAQLEVVLARHPHLVFQLPHFGSQPEIHRLPNLGRWLDMNPNVVLDTASSRWMARELSKDVKKAREFLQRYSDRILFGTDVSVNGKNRDYYSGRYTAQRILWETDNQGIPLPFPDADTKDTGGTIINGLDLPLSVLRKLYWENAIRIYGSPE